MLKALSSLRVRLVLLVLVAVAPAAVLIFLSAQQRRDDGEEQVRNQALSIARLTAAQYDQAIESTRTFLLPLAQVFSLVTDLAGISEETCQPFFADLIEASSSLVVVAAASPDGTVICANELSNGTPADVADAAFFTLAIDTGEFTLGPVTTDAVTGLTVIHAAYPILGPDGSARLVLYAGLDLTTLSESVAAIGLPNDSFVTIVDQTGTILARYPEPERWVGQSVATSAGFANVLAHPEGLGMDGESLDGTEVVIGSVGTSATAAPGGLPSQAFVSVGIPRSAAYASIDSRLRTDLLWLLGVAIVAAGAAWFGGGFVLGGLRRYVQAAGSIAQGNFSARTGPPYPNNELGDLGRAFDAMAGGIEGRDHEIRALNEGLEHRVIERTEELEAVNRDLESFSYSVSHDLRAPLRAIDGFTRILMEEHSAELSDEAQHYFGLIQGNARQMGNLVDDLLTFARLGRTPLSTRTLRMRELVSDVFEGLMPGVSGRRVEITIDELPTCEADPVLIRQVVQNLLDNALKFTRPRDVAQIRVGGQIKDGMAEYFVSDNGVGFDMQYSDKLFGVFQRLHRPDEYEGTGVGLAIVQRIVQRHGGQVWFEATPDAGATFHFSLKAGASA